MEIENGFEIYLFTYHKENENLNFLERQSRFFFYAFFLFKGNRVVNVFAEIRLGEYCYDMM